MKRLLQDRNIHILTGFFALSRLIFYAAGIRMNVDFIIHNEALQLPDLYLLKTKLAETLFYMHGQPPLFNLYCALLFRFFEENLRLASHIPFLFLGWLQTILLFKIMQRLNIRPLILWSILAFHLALPSNILYENWLFYTYPVVTMLLLSLYLLLRYAERGTILRGVLFFSCLAIIALTRSMFHLIWIVSALFLLIYWKKKIQIGAFPHLIRSSVLPISLVFGWYVKNFLLFGCFTSSSWLGMNMSRIIRLDSIQKKEYPVLACSGLQTLDIYKNTLTWDSSLYPHIAALHEPVKRNKAPNLYHIGYITISKKMQEEAFDFIKKHPAIYLKEVLEACTVVYLQPASLYLQEKIYTPKNYGLIEPYINLFNLGTTIILPTSVEENEMRYKKFQILRSLPVGLLYFCVFVFMIRKRRDLKNLNKQAQLAITFILFNLLYVFVIGNTLEYGENMRFRYQTTSMGLVLIAVLLNMVQLRKHKKSEIEP